MICFESSLFVMVMDVLNENPKKGLIWELFSLQMTWLLWKER